MILHHVADHLSIFCVQTKAGSDALNHRDTNFGVITGITLADVVKERSQNK